MLFVESQFMFVISEFLLAKSRRVKTLCLLARSHFFVGYVPICCWLNPFFAWLDPPKKWYLNQQNKLDPNCWLNQFGGFWLVRSQLFARFNLSFDQGNCRALAATNSRRIKSPSSCSRNTSILCRGSTSLESGLTIVFSTLWLFNIAMV